MTGRWDKHNAMRWLLAVLLFGAVVAVYAPALRGDFIWDDDQYVAGNADLRSAAGLARIWTDPTSSPQYYPLVFTSFWLEYRCWGSDPSGYHLTNVFLHAVNALLVWLLLSRLKIPGARIAALVFALHPVHVESVAWISERKNVLSGFFFLLSLLAALPAFGIDSAAGTDAEKGRRIGGADFLSLAAFIGALLSKTVTAVLPVLLIWILWWKRGRIEKRRMARLAPYFALAVLFGSMTIWMERFHVGAAGAAWNLGLVERFLVAGRAVWFYLAKLVWPHPLIFMYPRWHVDAGMPLQYIFPGGIFLAAAGLWGVRRRIGPGPLVALGAFMIGLLPALGFIDFYPMRFSFVADHFQYLASIAPIALFGAGIGKCLDRTGPQGRLLEMGGCLLMALLLAWSCVQEEKKFSSLEALWQDTLTKNPQCWAAHNNLGDVYQSRGDFDRAEMHYAEAVRLDPDFFEGRNNLGLVLARRGDIAAAAMHLARAAEREPARADVRNNLAAVLVQQGRYREAADHYAAAIRLEPGFAEAHNNFGLLRVRQRRFAEAVSHYTRALGFDPGNAEVLNNLGYALAMQGRFAPAAVYFQRALRADPKMAKARSNLNLAGKILHGRPTR